MAGIGYTADQIRASTPLVYGRNQTTNKKGEVKYLPPFYAKLPYKDSDGKRHMLTCTFPADTITTRTKAAAAAMEWRDSLILEAARREYEEEAARHPHWMVPDYADRVIALSPANPTTKDHYRVYLRRIRERFDGIAVDELTAEMVADWIQSMEDEGLAAATIVHAHALLSQVMRYAVEEDELIARNPCKKRAARPPKRTHKEPNALGASERGRLLDYLETAPYRPVRLAAYISILTSMRLGEVCGLRWKDVDLDRGIIHVRNSVGIAQGGTYQKPPKTGASIRDIPVAAQLSDALKSHRADMWNDYHALTKPEDDSAELLALDDSTRFGELFVIGNVAGEYANPTVISKQWASLADTLELVGTQNRKPTFHDLRHTFITAAITDASADVKTVASMAGHSKVSHTLDIYASADPDAKARLAATIDEITRAEKEAARTRRESDEKNRGLILPLATGTEGRG